MATADKSGTDCSSLPRPFEAEGQQGPTGTTGTVTKGYACEDGRGASVARKKKMWTICIGIAFLVISVVGGTLIGWIFRVKNFHAKDTDIVVPGFSGRQVGGSYDIFVLFTFLHQIHALFDVVDVDATLGTITIFWIIDYDTCSSLDDGSPCPDVNIYCDQNVLVNPPSPQAPPSTNLSTTPIFTWSTPATSVASANYASSPVFKTVLLVVSAPRMASANLQNYPFDIYISSILLFAREVASNSTVGFQLSTAGIPVGFTLESQISSLLAFPGFVSADLTIKRGSLVKAYALIIVISVWIITLIFVYTTLYSLLGGYPQRVEFLVIPVATLFTVTQLRATMPGAPNGFGAIIDYVALLPCLALMSLCGSVSIAFLAFSNPESPRKTVLDTLLLREQ
ncbi:hypothetical protein BJV78DRAFT_1217519 [Lactifluus subvellereus]|nr:hypothetical protein BJV78DRAFT_1217519 [Lactifluus subvellereus]